MHDTVKIVLVTNIKKIPSSGYKKHMSNLDFTKLVTNKLLARTIKKLGYDLIHYTNLEDFVTNIIKHKNDLVFPYHFGIASKVRQSFVQTFCESYGVKYIGGDAYSQTIGNDKALSKEICRYSDLKTPTCKILFDKEYPPDILSLKLPIIVKPQFEGDSIGISDKNVFHSYKDVLPFAANLLDDLGNPVIIEEFIEGRELSVSLVGYKRKIKKIGLVENVIKHSLVSSYKDKKFKFSFQKYRNANELLNEDIVNKMTNLFHSLDKIEFMRIDFIYSKETFYNIELTVDPDLSEYSCMYLALKNELSYCDFIELLILNCMERYKSISRYN